MRISAKADYAVRAALELAAVGGDGPVKGEQVAGAQSIPIKFLENILVDLRQAGIVQSRRGPDGGYWLARPAAEVSVAALRTLRSEPGRDILVLNSATLIQSLLADDLVDDLRLAVVPVLLGGGLRLLPDGVATAWSLRSHTAMADGAIAAHYRRIR